jgi:uncharacterized repeat protein (TIGR04052 family)
MWLSVVLLAACKKEEPPPPPPEDTAPLPPVPVTVNFRAVLGGADVACDRNVIEQGATLRADVRVTDLKLFIMNLGFTDASGNTSLVELDEGAWQNSGIAKLDFEDGANFCEGGTPETNKVMTGMVAAPPEGGYTGLVFTIGVPVEQNHRELDATALPILQDPALFTGPLNGYRFFKFDMTTQGEPEGYPIHVRSSGCTANEAGVVEGCISPNRITFVLPGFDAALNTVVFNLSELLTRNDLDDNWPVGFEGTQTADGCQSDVTDQDCRDAFTSYGMSALPQEWIVFE